MDAETKKYLDRIYAKVKQLAEPPQKMTWVGPRWITKITGWNREDLRQARAQRIIEFKESDGGGWLYRLESVPREFIKTV